MLENQKQYDEAQKQVADFEKALVCLEKDLSQRNPSLLKVVSKAYEQRISEIKKKLRAYEASLS